MAKYVETTHPQKVMGLYVNLAKALNALDEAGECVRVDEGGVVGIVGNVEWDPDAQRYTVVQA